MPKVDIKRRRIRAKIVYYGPGLSGKTANVQYISDHMDPEKKGRMRTLHVKGAGEQYIEVLPIQFEPLSDFDMIYNLCTVPGKASLKRARKNVLKGLDGVVFVADSRQSRLLANLDCLDDLRDNLTNFDINLEEVPHVIQYNRRDCNNVAPVRELRSKLNSYGVLEFEAVASQGQGVMETMRAIVRKVRDDIERRL
ncbi:MAG: GTP-binding protein [Planctomycetota bacterium]